ncbi:hypothetical protein SAMN05660443_1458 [Marinospirillum celere]|uniref:Uncharacterized protein n=1 Tax=Marinospirillum celere TaxID=1122252 RepID=A0A1I1G8Y6_9GAMM|nr:hypothetical protein [Marinospirillum celere]SFC07762.1 hypothetical protein SAMN05660443_1458 [Marinospirillum celere]
MIESNFGSQAAAVQRQAQGQDVRSQQAQQEANDNAVAEQASSQPVASSGAEAVNSVSTQPSDVVTRLGETPDEVPLYESGRPNGSIIRPAIELAQNAEQIRQADQQTEQAVAQRNEDEDVVVERNADEQAERQANDSGSPARGNDPSPDDVQDMV